MDKPLTRKALAERWETTPNAITKMVASGLLPAFTVGSRRDDIRIPVAAVQNFEVLACQTPLTAPNPRSPSTADSGSSTGGKTASLSDALYLMNTGSLFAPRGMPTGAC